MELALLLMVIYGTQLSVATDGSTESESMANKYMKKLICEARPLVFYRKFQSESKPSRRKRSPENCRWSIQNYQFVNRQGITFTFSNATFTRRHNGSELFLQASIGVTGIMGSGDLYVTGLGVTVKAKFRIAWNYTFLYEKGTETDPTTNRTSNLLFLKPVIDGQVLINYEDITSGLATNLHGKIFGCGSGLLQKAGTMFVQNARKGFLWLFHKATDILRNTMKQ